METEVATTFFRGCARRPHGRVLILNGWGGERQGHALDGIWLSNLGFDVMTFDYRGRGETDGDVTITSRAEFVDDCIAAHDALAERSDARDTFLYGTSYGGYLGCCLINERPVSGVLLRVPANFTRDGYKAPFLAIEECDQSKGPILHTQANDGLRTLGAYGGSALIVASAKDEIIYPNINLGYEQIAAEFPETMQFVTMMEAGHNLSARQHYSFMGMMENWFKGHAKEDALAVMAAAVEV